MPSLHIVIRTKNETEPAFPEITDKNFAGELNLFGAAILEAGMGSGKTSIGFALTDSKGKMYMAQTSAEIINALVSALKGAEQRFADIAAKKN